MNSLRCDEIQDLLPDLAAGALPAEATLTVTTHVTSCETCRATFAVVRALRADAIAVPSGLEARVRTAVVARRPVAAPWRYARPLALAASLAGAVLIGREMLERAADEPRLPTDTVAAAAEGTAGTAFDDNLTPPYSTWPGVDGSVAGSATLEDLSVEELEALLKELES